MTGHASATEEETLDQLLRLARQTALLDRLTRGRILLDSLLNGTYQTELAELDALEFVRGLADSAGLLTERHGISVETNYAPGEELRAVFDLKLVETALLHLMCNALEHMRPGCTLLLEARAEEDGGRQVRCKRQRRGDAARAACEPLYARQARHAPGRGGGLRPRRAAGRHLHAGARRAHRGSRFRSSAARCAA